MSKRLHMLMVVLAVLLIPSVILAGASHKLAVNKAAVNGDVHIVPLVVTNEANLAAMDIPLKFSEGVTLKEVTFEDTRVEYFDLKVANIDNAENKVIIGLLPQLSAVSRPDLKAGTGVVANLVFEVNDPTVTEISLEAFETKAPGHFLGFVYHDFDQNGVPHIRMERAEFEGVTVALSETTDGADLPDEYALNQNYPNPFNPSTEIAFDLPVASHVELTVFNILGQQVEKLVDGEREAGQHTVTWEASRYSSGVYFYRVQAKNFSATKKMLLLK